MYMKHYTRKNEYKASNVCFNATEEIATSYDWWQFVKRINGLLVFNEYRYSVSTNQHQRKVKDLLKRLGIQIDLIIECPAGLQNVSSAVKFYKEKIEQLTQQTNKPRTREATKLKYSEAIAFYESKRRAVESLLVGHKPNASNIDVARAQKWEANIFI